MSTETARRRKHDGGTQPNRAKHRQDFVTMYGDQPVFIVWREGARMPQSFSFSHAEAVAMAKDRCQPGERLIILKAERIGTVACPLSPAQYQDEKSATLRTQS